MTPFLFVTHLTPKAKRSALRTDLNEIYFRALNEQSYPHWKVLVFGDEERNEERFRFVRVSGQTKEERHRDIARLLKRDDVRRLFTDARYTIKLDDDDIINPGILERVAPLEFDIYYDEYHTFIDTSSGSITQQQRSWIASTCIHRSEHLFKPWNGPGASEIGNILYTDHSKAWHLFYNGMKKMTADRKFPVYARVLSPTSITAGLTKIGHTSGGINYPNYYEYLRSFGDWSRAPVSDFERYMDQLAGAWRKFSGEEQRDLPVMRTNFVKKIMEKMKGSNEKKG